MKTTIIALTLFASVLTQTSNASDGTVTPEVLESFQSKFTTAKNADWTKGEGFYKVQFLLNGRPVTAFYNPDGTMTAITRNISPDQLPVSLQTGLKNEYEGYWIANLFELSNDEGVQYYVTLENADAKMILKSSAASWSLYQKGRKD